MAELQGLFLDFYGTVVGGDRLAVESACQAVVRDHHLPLTAAELAVRWGRAYFRAIEAPDGDGFRNLVEIERDTLIETVSPLVGHIDPEPYVAILQDYLANPPLCPEIREVLRHKRLPVCIVSNADNREIHKALERNDLRFDFIVTSESARSYKPDPTIFGTALRLTGWRPERVIHIGDSLHSDVGGARAAGLKAVWVCREDRISDVGCEQPDQTWSDLRPIINL
ncbi:MAG TPA: HAD family hydrolase [Phycisphaerae bacterium]|nr:HAD family hydrolase [Phycisphaerae bacterium]HRR86106.1 HAD family hydrolase [Phycisphaerae bacterium]